MLRLVLCTEPCGNLPPAAVYGSGGDSGFLRLSKVLKVFVSKNDVNLQRKCNEINIVAFLIALTQRFRLTIHFRRKTDHHILLLPLIAADVGNFLNWTLLVYTSIKPIGLCFRYKNVLTRIGLEDELIFENINCEDYTISRFFLL